MTSEHSESFPNDSREEFYQRHKGVALKRTLEEHALSASGPEAKKMAGTLQDANGMIPNELGTLTEDWSVPDKMVGLIIGRDGKQILRLQHESQCKVQLTSESNGTSERPCKLTGTKPAIEKVKEMIKALIVRGQESSHKGATNGTNQGEIVLDVPCPSNKAGLVIGRGGETIRGLQEKTGTKMVVVQDNNIPPHIDKPIRITGEPGKVEHAKKLVLDLINSASQNGGGGQMGGGGLGMDRGGGFQLQGSMGLMSVPNEPGLMQQQIQVPKQAVGVVIGKQGETIKRIQQETGARVRFQTPQDESHPQRVCIVAGAQHDAVISACNQIEDLIKSVLQRDDENGSLNGYSYGGMGRGIRGGRGGFRGGRGGGGRGGPMGAVSPLGHMQSPPLGLDQQEVQVQVPSGKCGLIIGKGGESIRNLMQMSGTYIELSRDTASNSPEKYFTIRGTPQNIETAQQMISEKIGNSTSLLGTPNGTAVAYQPNYGGQYQQAAQYGAVATSPGQSAWGQPSPYQQASNGTAQWGQTSTATTPNGDMSKSADPSASWAYYPYYQQTGGAQGVAGQPVAPSSTPEANNASAGPGGQPDYSQAWIEYYRQMGLFQQAEMIEHQKRGTTQPTTATQQQVEYHQQAVAPGAPSTLPANGASWNASPYGAPSAYGSTGAPHQPYNSYGSY